MIDREHDSINWTALITWIAMIGGGITWWYLFFTCGWFQTIMWTIVVIAIFGIIVKVKEHISMFNIVY